MSASNTDNPVYFEEFSGRKRELELLFEHLVFGLSRTAMITGPWGAGKTSLARLFAQSSKNHFAGGTYGFSAREFPFGARSVLGAFPGSPEPILVIIDDLESDNAPLLLQELPRILETRPTSRLLLVGRGSVAVPDVDLHLEVSPLGIEEAESYLAEAFRLKFDANTLEEILAATAGNPRSLSELAFALRYGDLKLEDALRSFAPLEFPGLVDSYGKPIASKSLSFRRISTDISSINDEVIARLAKDPRLLYSLAPRAFEELIAELLAKLGYEVTLTPMSRDGGKDILAAKRDHLGTFLFLVECKRFSPENRVGVALVRNLYGVVQAERATAGILATTSFFTDDARDFQQKLTFQMSLHDYFGVQAWLKEALGGRT